MTTIPKPTHGSTSWLSVRQHDEHGRTRFGASEAPTLMGCNPFADLVSLAVDKWTPPEPTEPNPAMVRGNVLEPALVEHAATLLGQPVITPDVMYCAGRLIATLDGLSQDGLTIVEAKTTTAYSSDDDLPDPYYWQAVAQLACLPAAERVLFIVLDKRLRLGTWEVRRNDDAIARLLDRADVVGEALDARRLPDEVQLTEKAVKALWPNPDHTAVELGAVGAQVVLEWQAAKSATESAEAREQVCRDRLVGMLAGSDTGTVDGRTVVTFKAQKGRARFDLARFKSDHPKLVEAYMTEGSPSRVLRNVK